MVGGVLFCVRSKLWRAILPRGFAPTAFGLGDIVAELVLVGGASGGTRRFNPRVLVCQHMLELFCSPTRSEA